VNSTATVGDTATIAATVTGAATATALNVGNIGFPGDYSTASAVFFRK